MKSLPRRLEALIAANCGQTDHIKLYGLRDTTQVHVFVKVDKRILLVIFIFIYLYISLCFLIYFLIKVSAHNINESSLCDVPLTHVGSTHSSTKPILTNDSLGALCWDKPGLISKKCFRSCLSLTSVHKCCTQN